MDCNILDLGIAKMHIERCYKRTNDFRYKTILTAIIRIQEREKNKPCESCLDKNCIFR